MIAVIIFMVFPCKVPDVRRWTARIGAATAGERINLPGHVVNNIRASLCFSLKINPVTAASIDVRPSAVRGSRPLHQYGALCFEVDDRD